MNPNDIDARLAAMEARTPGGGDPPALPIARRRGRMLLPSGLAASLLLAVAATAAAGGAIVATMAQTAPGVQNPGQPLAGANHELEGVAFGLRDGLESMLGTGLATPAQIRASGGGTASPLWRQILADVLDTEVAIVSTSEGAAFGAGILGAVGAG